MHTRSEHTNWQFYTHQDGRSYYYNQYDYTQCQWCFVDVQGRSACTTRMAYGTIPMNMADFTTTRKMNK